jgi:hypothetical protein
MQDLQAEARQAAPSAAEPAVALAPRLVQVELEGAAQVVLVEPLASTDQTQVEERLAAPELVARPVLFRRPGCCLVATQVTRK